jgi:hypothetical protein
MASCPKIYDSWWRKSGRAIVPVGAPPRWSLSAYRTVEMVSKAIHFKDLELRALKPPFTTAAIFTFPKKKTLEQNSLLQWCAVQNIWYLFKPRCAVHIMIVIHTKMCRSKHMIILIHTKMCRSYDDTYSHQDVPFIWWNLFTPRCAVHMILIHTKMCRSKRMTILIHTKMCRSYGNTY